MQLPIEEAVREVWDILVENFKIALEFEEIMEDENLLKFVDLNTTIQEDVESLLPCILKDVKDLPEKFEDLDLVFVLKALYTSTAKPFKDRPREEQKGLETHTTISDYNPVTKCLSFCVESGPPLNYEKTYVSFFSSNKFQLYSLRNAINNCQMSGKFQDLDTYLKLDRTYSSNELSYNASYAALNFFQKQAVKKVFQRLPTFVHGPPGTVKTLTLVETVYKLHESYPEANILITATSNTACNTIVEKLLKYPELKNVLFRIFSSSECKIQV